MMNFGEAIAALKDGRQVGRRGWNGKGMFLELKTPVQPLHHPYIAMWTVQKYWIPWLASQTDVLAEDWEVVG